MALYLYFEMHYYTVISITKNTQILKILYPVIPHDQIEDITTTVLPMIQRLVEYTSTEVVSLEDMKEHVKVESAPLPDKADYRTEQVGKIESDKNDKLAQFIEDKHVTDEKWTESNYGDSSFWKYGNDIRLRGDGCIIDTTWSNIVDYFNSLPDVTALIHIDKLNKKKQKLLAQFYADHPNFQCHIEKHDGLNSLIKDVVCVKTDTHGNSDSDTVADVNEGY